MKRIQSLFKNKTTNLSWFFVLMFLEMMFANFAHPVTPYLIEVRMLPAYTFGFAFSAMAFTNFLFSPFWGLMSNRYGRMTIYLIGCLGYALGQVGFALSMSFWALILARMVAGFFVGGVIVMQLTIVMDYSNENTQSSNLTIHATVFTIAGALGYLLGGFLGDYSISLLFYLQIIGLASSGVLAFLTFRQIDLDPDEVNKPHNWLSEINPLTGFKVAYKTLNATLWVFLLVVFLAQVGSIAFDQSFNFFIRNQFGFPPSYNGMLKAAFGILALVVNGTIGMYLVRRTTQQKPLLIILLVMSSLSIILFTLTSQVIFLIVSILLFVFNSLFIILIQTIAGNLGKKLDYSVFMGMFNAIKSFCMIIGSSVVGLVYSIQANYSFLFSGFSLLLAAMFLFLFIRTYKAKRVQP
jgi:DHA1 family multidrug resistance protein-like MFS transporter